VYICIPGEGAKEMQTRIYIHIHIYISGKGIGEMQARTCDEIFLEGTWA
jgi:hypothetical protein